MYMRIVIKHIFKRSDILALTRGPHMPTWVQVNAAKDQLKKGLGSAKRR